MGSTNVRFGSQFERFLYSSVGQDNDGMQLTVLSALARQDVDPWEEAAKLTQLPEERAVTQLALLLGALRNAPLLACPDPLRIAAPLIALLPRRVPAPPIFELLARATPAKHPEAISTLFTMLTYLMFMLISSWVLSGPPAARPAPAAKASMLAADPTRISTSSDTQ